MPLTPQQEQKIADLKKKHANLQAKIKILKFLKLITQDLKLKRVRKQLHD